jgi:hypothetical protein
MQTIAADAGDQLKSAIEAAVEKSEKLATIFKIDASARRP